MADSNAPGGTPPPQPPTGGPPMGPYPTGVRYPEPRSFPTSAPSVRAPAGNTAQPPAPGYSQYVRRPPAQKSTSGSHTLAIVAMALAVATVVVLVVGIQIHNKNEHVHTYAAPAAFDNYSRVTSSGAAQLDGVLQSFLNTTDNARLAPLYTKGSLAVYSDRHHVTFGTIYLATNQLGSLGLGNKQTVIDELLSRATIANGSFVEPGPRGGQAWCGDTVLNNSRLKACTWSGSKTSGTLIFTGNPSDGALHAAMVDFRQALEG